MKKTGLFSFFIERKIKKYVRNVIAQAHLEKSETSRNLYRNFTLISFPLFAREIQIKNYEIRKFTRNYFLNREKKYYHYY